MQNNTSGIIQFPKTPDKLQFVTFLKNKLKTEDIAINGDIQLSEGEMKQRIAENVFNTLFVGKINQIDASIDTLLVEWAHILQYIRETYPDQRHFIGRIQAKEYKNLFWNKDIIDRAEEAKKNGYEPLARLLAKGNLSKDEFEIEAQKFVGRVVHDDINDNWVVHDDINDNWVVHDDINDNWMEYGNINNNIEKLDKAIAWAQNIVIASTLFDESYWTEPEWEQNNTQETIQEEEQEQKRKWNKIDTAGIREHMIKCQNESLFDLFSKEQVERTNTMLREPFLNYISETISPTDAEYIKKHFKIIKYDKPKLKLQTVWDTNYKIFEDNYVEIFYGFLKSCWRQNMDYSIDPEEVIVNKEKTNVQKQIKKGSLEAKTRLEHKWNTFVGDKLKEKVKDFAIKGRHLYIEGVSWSWKSHLLQWLAEELHQTKPSEGIVYMTGIAFYNEYQLISAINRGQKEKQKGDADNKKKKSEYVPSYVDQFRNKILIIDGVEGVFSWGNRLFTKEAFLAACQTAKQVIMSGRCSPWSLIIPRDENPIKISDEIKNIQDIDMPTPKEQADSKKKTIIYNIFTELGDLFTQGLPLEGIANILVDHVPPNDYKRIIEGYLVARELQEGDRDELSIKKYIERKLKLNEIWLPIEDIISTVYNLLQDDNIRETIPWILRSEIDRDKPDELMKRIRSGQIRSDSTLWLFMELIIHFIHKGDPQLTQMELGAAIGKPASGWSILRSAKKREEEYPLLFGRIETGLINALYKKYELPIPGKK